MGVDDIADELYRLPAEEFTAARDRHAAAMRAAGDRAGAQAVKAMRRPSVSAWAVNQVVRRHPDRLDALLTMTSALLRAQRSLRGDELRLLSQERSTTIAGLVEAARAITAGTGRPLSDAALDEVRATLEASSVDEAAAEAVRRGRLVAPLRYAGLGFGAADMTPADARGADARGADAAAARVVRERTSALRDAERVTRARRQAVDRAERSVADAEAALVRHQHARDEAVAALHAAEGDEAAARVALDRASGRVPGGRGSAGRVSRRR